MNPHCPLDQAPINCHRRSVLTRSTTDETVSNLNRALFLSLSIPLLFCLSLSLYLSIYPSLSTSLSLSLILSLSFYLAHRHTHTQFCLVCLSLRHTHTQFLLFRMFLPIYLFHFIFLLFTFCNLYY